MKSRIWYFILGAALVLFAAILVLSMTGWSLGTSSDPQSPGSSATQLNYRTHVSDVEFGEATIGSHSVPIRGVLVSPENPEEPAPLIIVNTLRAPNCSHAEFALPCPSGTEEIRFDRGMTYFGEGLAEQGYAVLIPDLTGIWVSGEADEPFSQTDMWEQVVGTFVDKLRSDNAGTTDEYGVDLEGNIDLDHVGMMVHSRSGMLLPSAQKVFGEDHFVSAFGYAPFYFVEDPTDIAPAAPDVPYLIVAGDEDSDVEASGSLWAAEHVLEPRMNPLNVVQVPGFGHMFINRELQTPEYDDRYGCDMMECPTAADHEELLTSTALDWFNATVRGDSTSLPTRATDPLPEQLGGHTVRWLATTPGQSVTHLSAADLTATSAGSAVVCLHADPMNPEKPADSCPEPDMGVISSVSDLNHLTEANAETSVAGATGLAIHVLPFGSTSDRSGSTLTVTLTLQDGNSWETTLDSENIALADLTSDYSNGGYLIGTIRVALPADVAQTTVTGIGLKTGELPVEVRGIDIVHSS